MLYYIGKEETTIRRFHVKSVFRLTTGWRMDKVLSYTYIKVLKENHKTEKLVTSGSTK